MWKWRMPDPLLDDLFALDSLKGSVDMVHGRQDADEEHAGLLLGRPHGRVLEGHSDTAVRVVEQRGKFPEATSQQLLADALEECVPCTAPLLGCLPEFVQFEGLCL